MSPDDRDDALPAPAPRPQPPAASRFGSDIRVSDAERNQAIDLLRHHTAEGMLTLDEFSDRVGEVYEATTRGELVVALRELPEQVVDVPETQRRPVSHRAVVAVMSGTNRSGRWRPADKTTAFAFMGGVELDLREAEIDGEVIEIDAYAIMGGVEVIVPPGVAVDIDGFAFMGGIEKRVDDAPRRAGVPLVRIRGFALMGGITAITKKSRAEIAADRAARRERGRERHGHDHRRDRSDRGGRRELPELPEMYSSPPRGPRAPKRLPPDVTEAEAERMGDEIRQFAAPDGTVTILFSDIEASTELVEELGDRRANEIFAVHNEIVRDHLKAHGGFEVKATGDGFMLAFSGASRALRCAIAIQRSLDEHAARHPEEAVRVRMGLNTGEALRDGNDFLGRTVIVASRLATEADGGEVLVSSVLRELCGSTGEFTFGAPRDVLLKGLAGTHTVYPVEF